MSIKKYNKFNLLCQFFINCTKSKLIEYATSVKMSFFRRYYLLCELPYNNSINNCYIQSRGA